MEIHAIVAMQSRQVFQEISIAKGAVQETHWKFVVTRTKKLFTEVQSVQVLIIIVCQKYGVDKALKTISDLAPKVWCCFQIPDRETFVLHPFISKDFQRL